MAKFDWMFLGLIIVGTVIASYVLNLAGYLTHSSPMKAKTGRNVLPASSRVSSSAPARVTSTGIPVAASTIPYISTEANTMSGIAGIR